MTVLLLIATFAALVVGLTVIINKRRPDLKKAELVLASALPLPIISIIAALATFWVVQAGLDGGAIELIVIHLMAATTFGGATLGALCVSWLTAELLKA